MISTRNVRAVFLVPILIMLALFPPKCVSQDCTNTADYCWNCSAIGDFTAGSVYEKNLNTLLFSTIIKSSQNDVDFFRNASSGGTPNEVNAIGLCRGDVEASTCSTCLNKTSGMVLQMCPKKKEAILWGELCMIRYSSQPIFSIKLDEPVKEMWNPDKFTDISTFEAALTPLLNDLIEEAASNATKLAFDSAALPTGEHVHALLQCTPDLSQTDCSACLNDSASRILDGKLRGRGNLGGRVLKPSCTLRFETGESFYNKESMSPELTSCSQTSDFCWSCYGLPEETNSNSVYTRNLGNILSSMTLRNGFYNVSRGDGTDRVSVIAMCRGDLSPEACQECVHKSSQRLVSNTTYCINRKRAIAWDESCMVRFSNESIFMAMQGEPSTHASNPNKVIQPESFKAALDPLLAKLTSTAASGDSRRKYDSGRADVEGYKGIYAFAQCTPDLDKKKCSECLQDSVTEMQQCCEGVQGVKLLKPSCVLRYEVNEFFGRTTDLTDISSPLEGPPSSPPPPPGPDTRNIIISVAVSVTVVVLICVFIIIRRRKTHVKLQSQYDEITGAESLHYCLGTIRAATEDFSEEHKLGSGGFGDVFRGKLSDGQLIAVKRLSKTSDQGDKEFKNEVTLLAKLQHRNLVRLLGFCLHEKEKLLIYEYVPNSSLDKYIFNPTKRTFLDWDRRYKIIKGIARGLLYIHEDSRLKIVHCDLKAGNVLLDDDLNPKISDFGMARLFALDETQGNTKKAAGTYGYMAPEYATQGHFSVKSDVFSFGVLLLEIINGQKNGHFRHEDEDQGHLLTYAWKYWSNGTGSTLIDPLMLIGSGTDEIMKCIHIGLLCVQENIADRPTMDLVVHMLHSRSHDTLAVPAKPGFFMGSSIIIPLQSHSQTDSTQASVDEATITGIHPRA